MKNIEVGLKRLNRLTCDMESLIYLPFLEETEYIPKTAFLLVDEK